MYEDIGELTGIGDTAELIYRIEDDRLKDISLEEKRMDKNIEKIGKGIWAFLAKLLNKELANAIDEYKAFVPLIDRVFDLVSTGETGVLGIRAKHLEDGKNVIEILDMGRDVDGKVVHVIELPKKLEWG